MKKITLISFMAVIVLAASCSNNKASQQTNEVAKQKNHKIAKQYTCTMHPEVIKDKAGVCPKCGMDLVEKENK